MDGKPYYQTKTFAIAPFVMLYFNDPETTETVEVESDINSLTFFKSHEFMFDGEVMPPNQVRDVMLNPEDNNDTVERFMMVDDDGVCYPAHLPMLEDLFGYSEVFKKIVRNELQALQTQNTDIIIPPYLCACLDPKPKLDFEAPVFALGNLLVMMSFASYTDAFQVNQIFSNIQVAEVNVLHAAIQEEIREGLTVMHNRRYHTVRIRPVYTYKYCVKPMPLREGSRIITWNVRGVSRPSFLENFEILCSKYHPQVFILVESRISPHNMRWIMTRLASNWEYTSFGDVGLSGGPTVFIYDKMKVKIMDFLYNKDPWIASVRIQGIPRSSLERERFA